MGILLFVCFSVFLGKKLTQFNSTPRCSCPPTDPPTHPPTDRSTPPIHEGMSHDSFGAGGTTQQVCAHCVLH